MLFIKHQEKWVLFVNYLECLDLDLAAFLLFNMANRICWISHWTPSPRPSPDTALLEQMCQGFSLMFSNLSAEKSIYPFKKWKNVCK